MNELRSEKINECTEPLWKTTPIKIDNLYIKLYTEEQWNVTEAHQTMRVASETIKRVCIQWVVKARCTMIPFRVCRSDGWRNRVSDRPVCHHLIRNRSKKKEMLDCIFSHSHSNPLAGHRSSYMSSILIQSILSSGNDVTRYGIGAINVRFVASSAHAFSVVADCVFLAVYGLSHISCESQMFPCAATPSLGGEGEL